MRKDVYQAITDQIVSELFDT